MATLNPILDRYVSRDESRTNLSKPHQEDGLVIASNSHVLLIAPVKHFEPAPPAFDSFVKWRAVVPYDVSADPVFKTSVSAILDAYPTDLEQPVYEECKTCEGTGTQECECCGSTIKCDQCGGREHTGKLLDSYVPTYIAVATARGVWFDFTYLKLIADTAQMLGIDKVAFHRLEHNEASVVKLGDVDVIIMPIMSNDSLERENCIPIPEL